MKVMLSAITVVMIIMVSLTCAPRRPVSARFDESREPSISDRDDERMLVVEAEGDPNVAGGRAFGLLFQLYYSIQETPKGPMQPSPRARWPELFTTPKSEWVGLYAMPVPETVIQLPPYEPQKGLKASLETWEYGQVAEIVHVGPYDKEEPTVQRLMQFVNREGYVIAGPHEEEYIKGPTMYGKGNPEEYVTIIRYRVEKAGKQY